MAVSEGMVNLTLETDCGTIPGSGADVGPGIPDAWCSLYRVHQWNQREREAAEDATQAKRTLAETATLDIKAQKPESGWDPGENPGAPLNWEQSHPNASSPQLDQSPTPEEFQESPPDLNFKGVEATGLTPIPEEEPAELQAAVSNRQWCPLRTILEVDEEVQPPEGPPVELKAYELMVIEEERLEEAEEPLEEVTSKTLSSFPLASRTQRRALRRDKEKELRKRELEVQRLKAERDLAGGLDLWNQDSQLTTVRDEEGTLLLVFWALLK
ncbi:hypothetical protein CYMTET_9448 [Cymbomonas tetramitiformis]|uniref:Uncharacterized protein n=1 Tax=Cymbomonas tetramitiformis TaxID=36881 RepID=A0AAE0GRF7_9CHLO|nr:hypothetical protein CYMTET_9448 [Cymbomonas tetramitiformis]